MKAKIIVISVLTFFVTIKSNAQTKSTDYFGQPTPGDSAVIFAPDIISVGDVDHHIGKLVFSPDGNECYYTVWGKKFSSAKIYYTKREGNNWSYPVEASFSVGNYVNGGSFSNDGDTLFFNRRRPGEKKPKIWMVQRTPHGWGEPKELSPPINSDSLYWDFDYSETNDGTAYFCSSRPGGQGIDIWRTKQIQGQPLQIENLGTIVNSTASEFSSLIAPDGSFLIFCSERPVGHNYSNLYITFNTKNGNWTKPVIMERNDAGINTKNKSWSDPALSPDGKFLFFNIHGKVYWISTKIIADIKKEVFKLKITK